MAVPIYYTADMVRALPDDGNRCEVVRGELLVTKEPVGHALQSPADISWSSDTLVQPDVFTRWSC